MNTHANKSNSKHSVRETGEGMAQKQYSVQARGFLIIWHNSGLFVGVSGRIDKAIPPHQTLN